MRRMIHQDAATKRVAPSNPVIMIPARMQATRLPGKPLAEIAGEPMIVQVWRRAVEADLGPVIVAAGEAEIVAAIERAGGRAVLTRADHPTGTDRIVEALDTVDPAQRFDAVINLQGDLPTIQPSSVRAALDLLRNGAVDIGTLAAPMEDMAEVARPDVVKAIVELHEGGLAPEGLPHGRALYFTRNPAPSGEGGFLHHIGLYAYRRAALDSFTSHPPGQLERREQLEQLRALAIGLRIDVAIVPEPPLGVDTAEDLEEARRRLGEP